MEIESSGATFRAEAGAGETSRMRFCKPRPPGYADLMNPYLRKLPLEERLRLVEDLWDSIAVDQGALPLTSHQQAEIDRRLDAYEVDGERGCLAADVIADIRKTL